MGKQHPHVQTLMRVSLDLSTSQTTYSNYGAFSFWPISSLIIITSQMASHKASFLTEKACNLLVNPQPLTHGYVQSEEFAVVFVTLTPDCSHSLQPQTHWPHIRHLQNTCNDVHNLLIPDVDSDQVSISFSSHSSL